MDSTSLAASSSIPGSLSIQFSHDMAIGKNIGLLPSHLYESVHAGQVQDSSHAVEET